MTEHLHSIFLKAYDRKYRFIPVEIKVLVGIGLFVAILLLDFPAWQQPEMALLFAGIVAFFLGLLWKLTTFEEAWTLLYYLVKAIVIPFLSMWVILAFVDPILVDRLATTVADAIYIAIIRVERIVSVTLLISSLLILVHPEDMRRMILIKDTNLALGMAVFFRFVPMFFQDISEYVYSINERGADLKGVKNWISPRFWTSQIIPFISKSIVLSFNHAEWIHVALSNRQSLSKGEGV